MEFLDRPITDLAGVGAVRAKLFAKIDVFTFRDLCLHYPRTYIDHRHPVRIADLTERIDEFVTLEAVIAAPPSSKLIRKGMTVTKVRVADETGRMQITFFNNPYIKNMLRQGESYRFYGKVGRVGAMFKMTSPIFEPVGAGKLAALRPIYPATAGLSQKMIAQAVAQVLTGVPEGCDPLPESVRTQLGLCDWASALRYIHTPETDEQIAAAKARITFEQVFLYLLRLGLIKQRARKKTDVIVRRADDSFVKLQSFTLTNAQSRVIGEIRANLAAGRVMNRLLQGDVGSGKTLVAGDALWQVVRTGRQAAIMAPTEILARQHYAYFAPFFEKLGKKTVLLVGGLTAQEKRRAQADVEAGAADVIVGTHALIQKGVSFASLGLVVTDEQHRFGVLQRGALGGKGDGVHILAMSATPIPRTMALILYGDLDISILDELPRGRQKIDTFLVDSSYEARLTAFMQKQLAGGGQVYYVCPLVEENEESDLTSVQAQFDALQKIFGKDAAMLHGRMKAAEKDAVMRAFSEGRVRVLVSTTVVEVGVNVPRATLMIIKDAERFGLSQLHQLRGRVGRGADKSYCVLVSDTKAESARKRMKFFCSTNDGFKIAGEDLATRGPGDLVGARQSGESAVAEMARRLDMRQLERAQRAVTELLARDPKLALPENAALRAFTVEKIENGGDIYN